MKIDEAQVSSDMFFNPSKVGKRRKFQTNRKRNLIFVSSGNDFSINNSWEKDWFLQQNIGNNSIEYERISEYTLLCVNFERRYSVRNRALRCNDSDLGLYRFLINLFYGSSLGRRETEVILCALLQLLHFMNVFCKFFKFLREP